MNIVVLTGAGMSAESGVSTFRDSDGLWEQHRIEDVCTPEGWRRNRQLMNDFYNQRRKQLFDVEPNEGHLLLVELEKRHHVQIITQNVDNLHERAGSRQVLHLHGELTKVRSEEDESLIIELRDWELKIDQKGSDGALLRPHIVWFGEAVPEIENAINLVNQADLFIVIGTSLAVYPAASLLHYVPKEVPIYLIDPNIPQGIDRNKVHCIEKGAGAGMRELLTMID